MRYRSIERETCRVAKDVAERVVPVGRNRRGRRCRVGVHNRYLDLGSATPRGPPLDARIRVLDRSKRALSGLAQNRGGRCEDLKIVLVTEQAAGGLDLLQPFAPGQHATIGEQVIRGDLQRLCDVGYRCAPVAHMVRGLASQRVMMRLGKRGNATAAVGKFERCRIVAFGQRAYRATLQCLVVTFLLEEHRIRNSGGAERDLDVERRLADAGSSTLSGVCPSNLFAPCHRAVRLAMAKTGTISVSGGLSSVGSIPRNSSIFGTQVLFAS